MIRILAQQEDVVMADPKAKWPDVIDHDLARLQFEAERASISERLAAADAADRAKIEARRAETISARQKDRRRKL